MAAAFVIAALLAAQSGLAAPSAAPGSLTEPAAGQRLEHLEAVVQLSCRLTAEGGLQKCQVLSETPPNAGFGATALELVAKMKMNMKRPPTKGAPKLPVAGDAVVIPIRIKIPPRAVDEGETK